MIVFGFYSWWLFKSLNVSSLKQSLGFVLFATIYWFVGKYRILRAVFVKIIHNSKLYFYDRNSMHGAAIRLVE